MKTKLIALTFLPLAAAILTAAGFARAQITQGGAATKVQQQAPACLNDISRFEQTLVLVRQTTGEKAAGELKEKLLPATQEMDILAREGYCGLSRYLREKKLI